MTVKSKCSVSNTIGSLYLVSPHDDVDRLEETKTWSRLFPNNSTKLWAEKKSAYNALSELCMGIWVQCPVETFTTNIVGAPCLESHETKRSWNQNQGCCWTGTQPKVPCASWDRAQTGTLHWITDDGLMAAQGVNRRKVTKDASQTFIDSDVYFHHLVLW